MSYIVKYLPNIDELINDMIHPLDTLKLMKYEGFNGSPECIDYILNKIHNFYKVMDVKKINNSDFVIEKVLNLIKITTDLKVLRVEHGDDSKIKKVVMDGYDLKLNDFIEYKGLNFKITDIETVIKLKGNINQITLNSIIKL